MPKIRADLLAVARNLAQSRDEAARLILAGEIFLSPASPAVPPSRVDKAGDLLPEDAGIFRRAAGRYVGRGGYKLLGALEHFGIETRGLVVLDAGASTGGFTDCLLQRGAARVYAADAGKGLLHEKLRRDSRVIALEGVNLRLAGPDLLPEPVDLIAADLSFISLKAVLPALRPLLKPGGSVLALIKPQFEAAKGSTVRGVLRDEALRRRVLEDLEAFAGERLGLRPRGVIPSSVKVAKGNQEYLAWWEDAAGAALREVSVLPAGGPGAGQPA